MNPMLRRFLWSVGCGGVAVSALPAQPAVAGSAVDRPLAWRFEKRWAIGGAGDEALILSHLFPNDIVADPQGHLWIVDARGYRVVEYDAAGRQLRALGRKGQGPGEFEYPAGLDVVADGSIRVRDLQRPTIVRFSKRGDPLPDEPESPRLQKVVALRDGREVGLRFLGDTTLLTAKHGSTVNTVTAFVSVPAKSTPPVCNLSEYPARPVFSPHFAFAAREQMVAYTSGEYRITLHDGARPLRVLTRATPRRASTTALARTQLGKGERMQIVGRPPCYIPPDLIIKTAGVAPQLPAYRALTIAPDGRIWALRFTVPGEPVRADVYHPERGYEGTVSLGSKYPATFLSDGSLVSLERDEDDVPVVVVYRVVK